MRVGSHLVAAPQASEARNVKKPTPFGKYFLLERINIGGMAEVFRAKAFGVEGFERLVAVKRILPNIAEDKEFIRMFIEEAKLSVQLNHANIAQIFDLGVVDGAYYIALEHVHGRDLRVIFDRCRQLGATMPIAQACFVVMKLCEGLDYAHNKRDQSGRELSLVHRDVSPQNVLVSFEGEVKIIDFGIAKAAGKGSKTQAGILKGKFGYMSPEQVRGLPVDRRSDVFSCGIVLYELLTGERLFVGESDFSTLEKVRNVEILPPSTYNRKIPDELERIVLKALSKDTEDRYQNAIDLHDELQAFVYTAGEFYSRKDLAGWMKKTFGKEIDEETAKLESYRQLKPPTPEAAPPRPATPSKPPTARRSAAVSAVKPPPPPPRVSVQIPAVSVGPPLPISVAKARRDDSAGDLSWDDDELETQIYDNPEEDPKLKVPSRTSKGLPLQAPEAAASGPMAAASAASPSAPPAGAARPGAAPGAPGPDLSSLSSTAKGWESAPQPVPPSPASTLNGIGLANGKAPHHTGPHPTGPHPTGPNHVAAPGDPAMLGHHSGSMPVMYESGAMAPIQAPTMSAPMAVPASMPPRAAPDLFDPMAAFGPGAAPRRSSARKGILMIAVGGAAVTAVAVAVVMVMTRTKDEPAPPPAGSAIAQTQPATGPATADQGTGFDLYVTPAGVTQWKLDGESRTDRLPSRIRGIAPGTHSVQIDGPAGFLSQTQKVEVVAGKAERVDIKLEPIQGIQGVFESGTAGVTVSLIVDGKRQELGPAPAKVPLDPRHSYQVLFEKPGYVSVNKPVPISGALEERIAVTLEKAEPDPPKVGVGPRTDPPRPPRTDPPKVGTGPRTDPPKVDPPKVDPPKTGGTGTLALGSKPSCEIYVDGASTGKYTPQPALALPAGKRKITLINNEYGIKESFFVEISPDKPAKMIKDYSDRLPK